MTIVDWLTESRERFQTQPAGDATRQSVKAFWHGAIRRAVDPYVGRPIWDRGDWDVLVVMDAARVDMTRRAVRDYSRLPEEVQSVWSNASCSIDWIERTFNGYPAEAAKTGYVTANPFANHDEHETRSADLTSGQVGHLELLYKTHWQEVRDGIETVPPEAVTDHAIDTWRRRDELGIDRLVVHYMQPHEPFIARPEWGSGDSKLLKNLVENGAEAGSSVYPRVRAGDVSLDEFRRVYEQNHHWILEELVERLLPNVDGDMVLTADHGNGLGEWGSWHHPPGRVAPPVRKVPWIEVECEDRQTIVPDVGEEEIVDASTTDQLAALGYRGD